MRKYPLAIKLNAAFPTDFLKQQLILWGVEQKAVPTRAAEVLTATQNFLEKKGIRANKLKTYTFAVGSVLYLLHAQPAEAFKSSSWVDLEVKGLGAVRNRLGNDPLAWDPYVFTNPSSISDPIARLQAENLSKPTEFDTVTKFVIKDSIDRSKITESTTVDDSIDALTESGTFLDLESSSAGVSQPIAPPGQSERIESPEPTEVITDRLENMSVPSVPESGRQDDIKYERDSISSISAKMSNVAVNATDIDEVATYAKDIRIQKFDPAKVEATTWVGNNVYELEMSGFKNERKMIAKLLSGLPDELRYAVRTDLQAQFPKTEGVYGGTIADFVEILKKHSMQTLEDMQEALQQKKIGSEKDLRKFYFQLKGLVDATLTKEQRATGVSEMLTTAKFREKLPANLRQNQLIASSSEQGLKLVSLAQRVMNRCKTDGTEVNSFSTKKAKKPWTSGKKKDKKFGDKKTDDKAKSKPKSNSTCDFCGLQGHTMANCYSFNDAKRARREEIARKNNK